MAVKMFYRTWPAIGYEAQTYLAKESLLTYMYAYNITNKQVCNIIKGKTKPGAALRATGHVGKLVCKFVCVFTYLLFLSECPFPAF